MATMHDAHAQGDNKVVNGDYKVEVSKPKDWEKSAGNDKAVAVFTDPSTQSQIEVVPTKLMTPDVAEVFFNTFDKTLTESGFAKDGEAKDATIGAHKGKQSSFKFSHSGVNLRVHVFSFVRKSTAWIVVGYMQEESEAKIKKQFDWTIENMKFQ